MKLNKLIWVFVLMFCINISYSALSDNMVGYWTLDDILTDSTGNGNTLTSSGTTFVTGKINNGVDFNAGTDYLEKSDDSNQFDFNDQFTISYWIKTTDSGSNQQVITKGNTGDYQWASNMVNGYAQGVMWQSSGIEHYSALGSTTLINDGNWHHIVVVGDEGVGLFVYVDNVLEASDTTARETWDVSGTAPLRIGQRADGTASFIGQIDELGIWNVALNITQIQELNNNDLGNTYPFFAAELLEVNIINITANGVLFANNTNFTTTNDIIFNITYQVNNSDVGNFTNSSITTLTDLANGVYYQQFEVCYNTTCDTSANYTYSVNASSFYNFSISSIITNTANTPVNRGENIAFNITGYADNNQTIYAKVCSNMDASWSDCNVLAQDLTGVEWNNVTETSIILNYNTTTEYSTNNSAVVIIYDGSSYKEDDTYFYVNQYPVIEDIVFNGTITSSVFYINDSISKFFAKSYDVEREDRLYFDGEGTAIVTDRMGANTWSSSNDDNVTMCLWFKPTTTDKRMFLIGSSSSYWYVMSIGGVEITSDTANDNKLHFVRDHNTLGDKIIGTTTIFENEWYFGCIVNNQTDSMLYLNGVLEGSASSSGIPLYSHALYIGGEEQGLSEYTFEDEFEGYIHDVVIYKDALNSTEINDIYHNSNYKTYSNLYKLLKLEKIYLKDYTDIISTYNYIEYGSDSFYPDTSSATGVNPYEQHAEGYGVYFNSTIISESNITPDITLTNPSLSSIINNQAMTYLTGQEYTYNGLYLNEIGNWSIQINNTDSNDAQTLETYTFSVTDTNVNMTINDRESLSYIMPVSSSVNFTLNLLQNNSAIIDYNITSNINPTYFNLSFNTTDFKLNANNSKNLLVTINSTSSGFIDNNFNITLTRKSDSKEFNYSFTISSYSVVPILSFTPLDNWVEGLYSDQSISNTFTFLSSGNDAQDCTISTNDNLINYATYNGSNSFNLLSDIAKNITITITNPAEGFYGGTLLLQCANVTEQELTITSSTGALYLISSTQRPIIVGGGGGGGGGGGSTIIIDDDTDKQTCDIDIDLQNIYLDDDKTIQSIVIKNNEDFAYEPSMSFEYISGSNELIDKLRQSNTISLIDTNKQATTGVRLSFPASIGDATGNVILSSSKCKDISIPIEISITEKPDATDLFREFDLENKTITETIVDLSEKKIFLGEDKDLSTLTGTEKALGWLYNISGKIFTLLNVMIVIAIISAILMYNSKQYAQQPFINITLKSIAFIVINIALDLVVWLIYIVWFG